MNTRRCLKIAARIGALLEQQIGLGVDAKRMLTERLYMRDVLLVCDAHRGNELAELATWFRRSAAERPQERLSSSAFRADGSLDGFDGFDCHDSLGNPSGFSPSGYPVSGFDGAGDQVQAPPAAAALIRQQLDRQRAAARHGGWLSGQGSARR